MRETTSNGSGGKTDPFSVSEFGDGHIHHLENYLQDKRRLGRH